MVGVDVVGVVGSGGVRWEGGGDGGKGHTVEFHSDCRVDVTTGVK